MVDEDGMLLFSVLRKSVAPPRLPFISISLLLSSMSVFTVHPPSLYIPFTSLLLTYFQPTVTHVFHQQAAALLLSGCSSDVSLNLFAGPKLYSPAGWFKNGLSQSQNSKEKPEYNKKMPLFHLNSEEVLEEEDEVSKHQSRFPASLSFIQGAQTLFLNLSIRNSNHA